MGTIMDCVITLCPLALQEYHTASFTARLEPVVIEKGNLLLCISGILKTMSFMRCILSLCVCVSATTAAFYSCSKKQI